MRRVQNKKKVSHILAVSFFSLKKYVTHKSQLQLHDVALFTGHAW
jgi:hypothetical protein